MMKYILQTPGMADRVLFVRRQNANSHWYIVSYQTIYPNMDFSIGRRYCARALDPCRSADEMQTRLDTFARLLRLKKFEERS